MPKTKENSVSEQEDVSFPIAAKVCEMPENSSLQDFNPLNDSEPNLEFDMMDQNDISNLDLHVKLMQDARTCKWQVKIRNLTKEQIDFISGPRLLPALSKAEAVVIEHGDSIATVENAATSSPTKPGISETLKNESKSLTPIELKTASKEITSDVSNTDNSTLLATEASVKPVVKPTQPHRSTAKNIDYSNMTTPDETVESDSDDYTPKPEPPPKLNNKHYPSASRIAAHQRKRSCTEHEEPKQEVTDNSKLESSEEVPADSNVPQTDKATKGELNITTVGLKGCVPIHSNAKSAKQFAIVKRNVTRITKTIMAL